MKIFTQNQDKKRPLGRVYCVLKGEKSGQFLVFLKYDKNKRTYGVLTLPECIPIEVSDIEFQKYLDDNFIEFVEKLPKRILKGVILEYNHRISCDKQ